jgi:hypothetical protein
MINTCNVRDAWSVVQVSSAAGTAAAAASAAAAAAGAVLAAAAEEEARAAAARGAGAQGPPASPPGMQPSGALRLALRRPACRRAAAILSRTQCALQLCVRVWVHLTTCPASQAPPRPPQPAAGRACRHRTGSHTTRSAFIPVVTCYQNV